MYVCITVRFATTTFSIAVSFYSYIVCTTEAIEIKGTACRVCALRQLPKPLWCMSMHAMVYGRKTIGSADSAIHSTCEVYGRVSRSYCLPLISMASVVQTGYTTPTLRFSDTPLVATPLLVYIH